ncbi:hypothetical protein EMIT0232MI5_60152 [Pseudomonas sp. IT-232MI5]
MCVRYLQGRWHSGHPEVTGKVVVDIYVIDEGCCGFMRAGTSGLGLLIVLRFRYVQTSTSQ